MAIEIPLKRKYKIPDKLWGYPRGHGGNGNRKIKSSLAGRGGYSDPYIKENHILYLKNGRKRTWIHKDGNKKNA